MKFKLPSFGNLQVAGLKWMAPLCRCKQGWPSWMFARVQHALGNGGPRVSPPAGRHSYHLPIWANTGSCHWNASVPLTLKATVQRCLVIPSAIVINAPPLLSVIFLELMVVAGAQLRGGFSLAGVGAGCPAGAVPCLCGASTRILASSGSSSWERWHCWINACWHPWAES